MYIIHEYCQALHILYKTEYVYGISTIWRLPWALNDQETAPLGEPGTHHQGYYVPGCDLPRPLDYSIMFCLYRSHISEVG